MIRLAVLLASVAVVNGYGFGAPVQVCSTFKPGHKLSNQQPAVEQTSDSPYMFTVDKESVENGGTVKITVGGGDFAGFFVAGNNEGQGIVGTFVTPEGVPAKIGECDDTITNEKTGVTHNSTETKSNLEFTWNAPAAPFTGSVCFKGAVAQEKNTFWRLTSNCVTVTEKTTTVPPYEGPTDADSSTDNAATTPAGEAAATTTDGGAASIISSLLIITAGVLLVRFY